eukprot:3903994-Alexandrium_andersonii.AAC.1
MARSVRASSGLSLPRGRPPSSDSDISAGRGGEERAASASSRWRMTAEAECKCTHTATSERNACVLHAHAKTRVLNCASRAHIQPVGASYP